MTRQDRSILAQAGSRKSGIQHSAIGRKKGFRLSAIGHRQKQKQPQNKVLSLWKSNS